MYTVWNYNTLQIFLKNSQKSSFRASSYF